jgi:hypothetical protein
MFCLGLGWVFALQPKISWENLLLLEDHFSELEEIQNEMPDLIDSQVNVWVNIGIQRSGWCFDTICRLRGVSKSKYLSTVC